MTDKQDNVGQVAVQVLCETPEDTEDLAHKMAVLITAVRDNMFNILQVNASQSTAIIYQ